MKRLVLALIHFYRRRISPHKKACCRFRPTCSSYALQAVERFGALRGGLMSIARILRCNPYGRPGYDPVPEHFSLRSGVGKYEEPSACLGCPQRAQCDGTRCIDASDAFNNKGDTL